MANVASFPHPQHNATVYNAAPQPSEIGLRHVGSFKVLGVLQLLLGCVSVLLSILGIILYAVQDNYHSSGSDAGAGIWCGIFFVVAGILGIGASKRPGLCQVKALMVLSILSAITSTIMMSIEGSAARNSRFLIVHYQQIRLYPLYVVLSLVAFAEFIASIACSAFCCSSACCGHNSAPYRTTVVTSTSAPMVAPGHFVTVQGAPQREIQPFLQQSQVVPAQPHPYPSYPVAQQYPPYPQQGPIPLVLPPQISQFQTIQSPPSNPHYVPGVPPEASTQPPPYTLQVEHQPMMKS